MIGDKTKKEVERMLTALFSDHWSQVKEAYLKAEDTGLTISLGISLSEKEGLVIVKAGIGFITERVKDQMETKINEAQGELFEKERKKIVKDFDIPPGKIGKVENEAKPKKKKGVHPSKK